MSSRAYYIYWADTAHHEDGDRAGATAEVREFDAYGKLESVRAMTLDELDEVERVVALRWDEVSDPEGGRPYSIGVEDK